MSEREPVLILENEKIIQQKDGLKVPEASAMNTIQPEVPFYAPEQTYQPTVIDFEIPRDSHGVRWKILQQEPEKLRAYIEAEAFQLVQKGVKLTHFDLNKNDKSTFFRTVNNYYEGGINELRSLVDPTNARLAVDPESGIYTDENGVQWGGRLIFSDDECQYLSNGKKVSTMQGRASNGNPTVLYRLDAARGLIANRNLHPKVDPITGIYVDDYGEQWASEKVIGSGRYQFARRNLSNIRTIQGKSGKMIGRLMNLSDLAKLTDPMYSLPPIDPQTNIYTNENGQWGSESFFGSRDTQYLRARKDKVRIKIGRRENGIATLFNLEDAERVLAERDARKNEEIKISPDQADEMMMGLQVE